LDIAAPTVVALETSSAWILILAVSLVTFPIVLLLRRLIDRPGGVASGVLLSLPLALPVVIGIAFHGAALPEVAVLRPIGESLISGAGKGLFDLLVFTDEAGGIVVPYALWGSPGPYLFLIGVSVSSVMVLRRLAGAVSVHRLIGRCLPIEESEHEDVAHTVSRLAAAAGVRRSPEVLLMPPGHPGACVAAGRRYRLLISSEAIEELNEDELEGLLAHEIAHLGSRDVPVVVVGGFLRDVVAWNPVGHLAFRKLTADREFEADRRAAALTGKPLAVASGLLKVYEMTRRCRLLAGPSVPFVRRRSKVSRRVHRLLAIADGGGVALRRSGYGPHLVAAALVAVLAMQVGARIGGQSDSAFAIVLGGPEIADVDVWEARAKTHSEPHKGRTQASGEGRSKPLEAEKRSLSLKDPRLTENLAVSVQDVPRWVDRMTRMAGRAGVSEAAVRAELQQSWHAVPVFSGPVGGGVSVYRMEHDLNDEVFGRALP
jgi:Zn-dependent protease with chaperone function